MDTTEVKEPTTTKVPEHLLEFLRHHANLHGLVPTDTQIEEILASKADQPVALLDPSGQFEKELGDAGKAELHATRALGLIPIFASGYGPNNNQKLHEYVSERYGFAPRWYDPAKEYYPAKINLDEVGTYSFKGDSDLAPLAVIISAATHELLFVYDYALVGYVSADGQQLFSRLD